MRLIDADELREFLIKAGVFLKGQDDKRSAAHAIGKVIEHIDRMPAVDVVPTEFHERCLEIEIKKRFEVEKKSKDAVQVTRCVDCKYWDMAGRTCDHPGNDCLEMAMPFDYCSYGERKTDGKDDN